MPPKKKPAPGKKVNETLRPIDSQLSLGSNLSFEGPDFTEVCKTLGKRAVSDILALDSSSSDSSCGEEKEESAKKLAGFKRGEEPKRGEQFEDEERPTKKARFEEGTKEEEPSSEKNEEDKEEGAGAPLDPRAARRQKLPDRREELIKQLRTLAQCSSNSFGAKYYYDAVAKLEKSKRPMKEAVDVSRAGVRGKSVLAKVAEFFSSTSGVIEKVKAIEGNGGQAVAPEKLLDMTGTEKKDWYMMKSDWADNPRHDMTIWWNDDVGIGWNPNRNSWHCMEYWTNGYGPAKTPKLPFPKK